MIVKIDYETAGVKLWTVDGMKLSHTIIESST